MNTKPVKKTKLWIILISLFVVIEVLLIGATLAWFTDQKSSSATLKFGTIELDKAEGATGLAVSVNSTTLGTDSYVMPGDKVDININVKLKNSSQPAYYLVYLDHDGLFGGKEFFFKSSKTVYATDGTKIYKVSENGTIGEGKASENVAGTISGGETQTLAFSLTIDEAEKDLTGEIEISCTVYAIQQANLTAEEAYDEIHEKEYATATFGTGGMISYEDGQVSEMTAIPSWKQGIANSYAYETISFYRTGRQTLSEDLKLNQTLTDSFDATQPESEKGKIKVYTNGTSELAFVSDYRIAAPEDSTVLFGWAEVLLGDSDFPDINEDATYKFNFKNFYTNNVTDMSGMFMGNFVYKELDLSKWDTSNVTDMKFMFAINLVCTELDLNKWDTSNVTDMSFMFGWPVLAAFGDAPFTKINVSNWNVKNVTNMCAMFGICGNITELDLSKWETNSVTNVTAMFVGCTSLKELDLSGFDLTNVTEGDDFLNVITDAGSTSDIEKIVLPKEGKWGLATELEFIAGYYMKSQKTNKVFGTMDMYANANVTISSDYAGDTLIACGVGYMNACIDNLSETYKTSVTSIKFEKTAPSDYTKISSHYTGIDIYANSTSTEIVFVSELTIYASEYGIIGFDMLTNLQKIEFNNFDTSRKESLDGMFSGCSNLTEVTISTAFTYDDNGTQTQFTKAKLVSDTGLNSDVVVKRGSETLG